MFKVKINDVEKLTGLTQKAIRLYESKGLIQISRSENGYRNYSQENVNTLKTIKLFREAGITITDIKLYLCGVVSLDELLSKRKKEILDEKGKNSDQYQFCDNITSMIINGGKGDNKIFTESEEITPLTFGTLCVGIDLGTTTISAVVMDMDSKEQVEVYSTPHRSHIPSKDYSEQRVDVILEKAEKLLCHIIKAYKGIVSIGITGQMHGIVYVDSNGKAVSNLINWQDKRADRVLEGGVTACEEIKQLTGESVFTGYGIATHYYNLKRGLVPESAVGFCSIMDLFAMRLCGMNEALTHTSIGAAIGLFDIKNGCFMREKLRILGIEEDLVPRVTSSTQIIGSWNGISISVPIGDNQASFIGSMRQIGDSVLINIGTGSQIAAVSDYCELQPEVELRPFIEGKYLVCGSALCGGSAYAMLEEFFRSYAVSIGMNDTPQYSIMNKIAKEAYSGAERGVWVTTSFYGKRSDPDCRGSIEGIDAYNFTPSALILGLLKGICEELHQLYTVFPEKKSHAVASGGAVKKNPVFKNLIEDRFEMDVSLNRITEEAATGAALFSALAIGLLKYEEGFPEFIKYS